MDTHDCFEQIEQYGEQEYKIMRNMLLALKSADYENMTLKDQL